MLPRATENTEADRMRPAVAHSWLNQTTLIQAFLTQCKTMWLVAIRFIRSGLFLVSEWVLRDDCSSCRYFRIWSPDVCSSCFEL